VLYDAVMMLDIEEALEVEVDEAFEADMVEELELMFWHWGRLLKMINSAAAIGLEIGLSRLLIMRQFAVVESQTTPRQGVTAPMFAGVHTSSAHIDTDGYLTCKSYTSSGGKPTPQTIW
jgi:hypothetical protein